MALALAHAVYAIDCRRVEHRRNPEMDKKTPDPIDKP
jgi:hypothetical protein